MDISGISLQRQDDDVVVLVELGESDRRYLVEIIRVEADAVYSPDFAGATASEYQLEQAVVGAMEAEGLAVVQSGEITCG